MTTNCHTIYQTPSASEQNARTLDRSGNAADHAEAALIRQSINSYTESIVTRFRQETLTPATACTYAKAQLSEADFEDYHRHAANAPVSIEDLLMALELAGKAHYSALTRLTHRMPRELREHSGKLRLLLARGFYENIKATLEAGNAFAPPETALWERQTKKLRYSIAQVMGLAQPETLTA